MNNPVQTPWYMVSYLDSPFHFGDWVSGIYADRFEDAKMVAKALEERLNTHVKVFRRTRSGKYIQVHRMWIDYSGLHR